MRAIQQQRRLPRRSRICCERGDRILRVASLRRGRRQRIDHFFVDRSVRIVVQDGTEFSQRLSVALHRPLGLRGPKNHVLAQQFIVRRFGKPAQRLWRPVLVVVVVAQRQRRPRTVNIRAVFIGKGGKLFVPTGSGIVQIPRQNLQLFLRTGIFLGPGRHIRRRGFWLASCSARRDFWPL